MAMIGVILNFIPSPDQTVDQVEVDLGGEDTLTVDYLMPAGEDSQPLPGDWVQLVKGKGTGKYSAVAYVDLSNPRDAAQGEKRMYARMPEGAVVSNIDMINNGRVQIRNENGTIVLFDTGQIDLQNANGFIRLLQDGTVNINGVTIAPDSAITGPNGLLLNNRQVHDHDHNAGPVGGLTGVNNP